jgi:hypothetical protein
MHGSDRPKARSRRLRRPTLTACLALALVAGSGALAAQASAAMISVSQACYVNADTFKGAAVTVDGSGFTAGDSIELTGTDIFATATVGADGTFVTTFSGPILSTPNPAASSFTITAIDESEGVTMATTTMEVANLAVATKPAEAKPSEKVMYTFSGFKSGAEIYAHYLHRNKVEATAKFGRATGPCGLLKAKAKFYPGTTHFDSYRVQFDDGRHYSSKSLPRLVTTLDIHIF